MNTDYSGYLLSVFVCVHLWRENRVNRRTVLFGALKVAFTS
jgi:hypothetical protein